MSLLSILIPLYNEEEFFPALLERVLRTRLPDGMEREIVVVDDASTDGSWQLAEAAVAAHRGVVRLIRHPENRGKGAAIRTAIEEARGEFAIFQDADLEYDPDDYVRLLKPLVDGRADVVYGSRFLATDEKRVLYFWHSIANFVLTTMVNVVADLNLTDMETCYKAFRMSLLKSIPIRSNRFGIEPEITIKLAKRKVRIYETPISYHGRTYEEGKKIGLKDAFDAFWVTCRYAFSSDIYKDSGPETLHALAGAPRFNGWMADTIRPYLGDKILEIGAGIGNLSHKLIPRRKRYMATDLDQEHLARLHNRFQHRPFVTTQKCDLTAAEDFRHMLGAFDTVVCLNVVEHVEDDLGGLKNIYSALEQGGRAIILVPHDQRIFGTLDVALGHYRRYRHVELKERMEAAGFVVEKIVDFNRVSRYPWYVSGRILKRTALSPFQMRVFDQFVGLWRIIDQHLPWPPTSIIAIGRK
jgi:SAM-dependent methyltransferase